MTDLPAKKQAAKAIAHTLRNISERPGVAWYLGHGTQTYALLTEAHATLHGITMEEAQENWPPADQPQFDAENLNKCPFCGSSNVTEESEDDRHYIECSSCDARGPQVLGYLHDSTRDAMNSAVSKWNCREWPR